VDGARGKVAGGTQPGRRTQLLSSESNCLGAEKHASMAAPPRRN
jgi:hypothetical protein